MSERPLLNQEEMGSLVDATAENHAKMMAQDWTPEQKQILVDNMAAVRRAADALRNSGIMESENNG